MEQKNRRPKGAAVRQERKNLPIRKRRWLISVPGGTEGLYFAMATKVATGPQSDSSARLASLASALQRK